MNIYDKMDSVLKTLDVDLIDSLVKRGQLKIDLDDFSVRFFNTFLTQELIDMTQEYLYFVFCTLYLVKNRTHLFIELIEGYSHTNKRRELLASSTHDFENSPKQAIDEYFYQRKEWISINSCEVKDTEPYWGYTHKSIFMEHCSAEEELNVQLGVVERVDFSVYTSDIPTITMTDIKDEDSYVTNIPFFFYSLKSNVVLSIDNAFNLRAELSLTLENSSTTIHEDFTGAARNYCKSLTSTLLDRSIYVTQPYLPTVDSSFNRYQSNPKLVRYVLASALSEIRSWISGPQPLTQPTATTTDEEDPHNLIMETNDFVSIVNIGVKAEDYANLEKLTNRYIGKFLIGHTYIIDDRDASWYFSTGGCHVEVSGHSNAVLLIRSKLTSMEESSGMSIIVSNKTKGFEYDGQASVDSSFTQSRTIQKIVECAHVEELIRNLDKILGKDKYYLTLLCLNKNQLLGREAKDSFKEELMGSIIRDLQYTTISYSLEPLGDLED